MRKIIFRGRTVGEGRWVYGYYFADEEGVHYIKERHGDGRTYDVEPETIGQLTGILCPKDNRYIYEGDIVVWKVGSIKCKGVVCWGEAHWNKGIPGHNMQSLHTYQKSTEVIGNIHDNPELLEK